MSEEPVAEAQRLQSPTSSLPEVEQNCAGASLVESDFITQAIPFESGKIARFIIPVDATEDDLLLLRDIFDVLLRRKFKIDIK